MHGGGEETGGNEAGRQPTPPQAGGITVDGPVNSESPHYKAMMAQADAGTQDLTVNGQRSGTFYNPDAASGKVEYSLDELPDSHPLKRAQQKPVDTRPYNPAVDTTNT